MLASKPINYNVVCMCTTAFPAPLTHHVLVWYCSMQAFWTAVLSRQTGIT